MVLELWFRAPPLSHLSRISSDESICVHSNPPRRDFAIVLAWRVCVGPGLDASPTRQPNNPFWWAITRTTDFKGSCGQFECSCRVPIDERFLLFCLPIFDSLVEVRQDQTWHHCDVPTSCSTGNNSVTCSRSRLISTSTSEIGGIFGGGCIGAGGRSVWVLNFSSLHSASAMVASTAFRSISSSAK